MDGKKGVLLVNLGTPERLSYVSMWLFLREFLWDRRVVEAPRAVWWVVLHVLILPLKSLKSLRTYGSIWDREKNASPLRVVTEKIAEKLREAMEAPDVYHAMRYGRPSIKSVLSQMVKDKCTRITVVPLYPQYAAATTATVGDEVCKWLLNQRFQPEIQVIGSYFDHPAYVEAVAAGMLAEAARLPWAPDIILLSFHGLPVKYVLKGDPYYRQCRETARRICARLNLRFWEAEIGRNPLYLRSNAVEKQALKRREKGGRRYGHGSPLEGVPAWLVFQSRFGKGAWLEPDTADALCRLPSLGYRNVLVVCPGFATDCIETLEELGVRGRDVFLQAGGERFALVPCLNDSDAAVELYRKLVMSD